MQSEPHAPTPSGVYDLFPAFPIQDGLIATGFDVPAGLIAAAVADGAHQIAIDGYAGTLWAELRAGLESALRRLDLKVEWRDTATCFLPEDQLDVLLADNLGGDDPLFGRLCERDLAEFFDHDQLQRLAAPGVITLIYGVGAALVASPDLLFYLDVPKDEIQKRLSVRSVTNLGARSATYKRAYFVDWPVLNRHKARLLPSIDAFIDGQNPSRPTLISGNHLRAALKAISASPFRVRPWFAPGPWGGQWMKEHFSDLPQDVPNYAWSFELIVPENGLVLESRSERLECSFDLLMFQNTHEVLGRASERFGYNFPIRFDYLDTIDGGNLSVQVHPRPDYIRQHFGEPFTQDESYYITTCKPGAQVYLGFRDGTDSDVFRREVERSQRDGTTIEIERFVNHVEAHQHDLFLIPSGTIHGSGANNLVLEISATPYIYTFKIYDWLRRDLSGKYRTLNVARAWENLAFERQEEYVQTRLCPQPSTIREGDGWREVFVGSHDALFYAVHRYEFTQKLSATTDGRCHILNVVEGEGVIVETANGQRARFNFAETFVIPAAAEEYRLTPIGDQPCKVVFSFVK